MTNSHYKNEYPRLEENKYFVISIVFYSMVNSFIFYCVKAMDVIYVDMLTGKKIVVNLAC